MTTRRVIAASLLMLGAFIGIGIALSLYPVRDPTYSCIVDAVPAAGYAFDNAYRVDGRIVPFPLGLECKFTSEEGERVTLQPDWSRTWLAAIAVSALVGGITLAVGGKSGARPVSSSRES